MSKVFLRKKQGLTSTRSWKGFCLLILVTGLSAALFFPLAFTAEIKYDSGDRRDPFVPLVGPDGVITKMKVSTDLVIEGIIVDSSGEILAVVNGDIYHAGDRVGEANIIQIFPDRLILSQEDEEKTIWLREEIIEGAEQ